MEILIHLKEDLSITQIKTKKKVAGAAQMTVTIRIRLQTVFVTMSINQVLIRVVKY